MKPTEILSSEHRVIEIVLDCLDRMTKKAIDEGHLERKPAEDAIEFIKGFADGCHHGKEEARLFPALVNKGIPQEGGPIAVMLQEHELGRMHVRGMANHLEAAAGGDKLALEAFVAHADGYVQLLRQHIMKEDRILFPMADRVMGEDDTAEVLRQFDQVEHEEMGAGTHERFLKIAEALADRYNIPKTHLAPHLSGTTGGCCHHKH